MNASPASRNTVSPTQAMEDGRRRVLSSFEQVGSRGSEHPPIAQGDSEG